MKPTAYILEGDPKELEKVIRENRIRINRGAIKFSPVEKVEEVKETLKDPDEEKDIPLKDPGTMDDKTPKVDDVKEVDLNADVKTPQTNDTKDVPAADAKEVKAPKKTSKTKKSE